MKFVGREAELDLLAREAALALEISSGRAVFLEGSPGAGKTSLVAEFLERIAAERPDLAIARGRCLQTFGSADPYLPFVEALKDLSDTNTSGAVNRETLSELLTELAPFWLSAIPVVGNILSATYSTAARLRGQPAQGAAPSREALFVQYLEVIKGLASQSPLLLFLDDLHWADHSSVALLAHVCRGVSQLPVMILGTLRRTDAELEKHPILDLMRELEREDLVRRVPLGEMDAVTLKALMAVEFEGEVSEPLQRWMTETAGGNPLFVSELARLLKQSGAVVEERGEWFLTDAVKNIEVPRSAEAVIETRIQRLEPEEVKLLQYASVMGNEFDSTVVSRLLEQDELEVLDALEQMERRYHLVQTMGEIELPDGDCATTYKFRHALVQTILYRQVMGKRRILLHRKAGESLEALFEGKTDDIAGKLARHYHEGRVKDPAYRHARTAADNARRIYAHWEAEEYFKVALENSPGEAESADLEERLGDVYDAVGYYKQGIASFQSSLAKTAAGDVRSLRMRRKILVLERKAGLAPAPELLRRVRELLQEVGEAYPEERCHLLHETSMLPDAVGVVEAVQEAVAIARTCDNPLLLVDALERISFVMIFFSAQPKDAFPYLDEALQIVEGLGDLGRSALYHCISGIAYMRVGRYEDARREFHSMLDLSERVGDPRKVGGAYTNLGCVYMRLRAFEEAEKLLQRAASIHERRDRSGLVHSLLNLAELARRSGNLPLAIERYHVLIDHAQKFEYWTSEAVAHAGLGRCLLEEGRIDEARECAWRSLSVIADREDWFEDRDFVEVLLARLGVMDGTLEEATQRLARAAQVLASFDAYSWAHVELERVRVLSRIDPASAHEVLVNVVAVTAGMQLPLDEEIREVQASLPSLSATRPEQIA
jgi:tetratricopeptide (TPR) repeat protein